jgi:hypothetical protein
VVEAPDEVFWRVAARAELQDQKVPDFVVDLMISVAAAKSPVENDPLLRLWREGLTDSEIARELDVTNQRVSDRRRRFGLPANRRSSAGTVARAHLEMSERRDVA